VYSDFLKAGINIPLEFLPHLLDMLNAVHIQCECFGIYDLCPKDDEVVGDESAGIEFVENYYKHA
jgi:hypothetical protein